MEKKAHRSLLKEDLEEPKAKKCKNLKKKKSKDKHQERDYRLDTVYFNADLRRYKKKKRNSASSEDFEETSELHSPKATNYETVYHFQQPESSLLLTDVLYVESTEPFQEEMKDLRMESRADRCHLFVHGQESTSSTEAIPAQLKL
ncbi:Ubiquitin carboxyl-terminal hydrolase 42 [Heterocephalus glaber]|uniref:Ubiquitin carboxyl-terminal hydrolase 42 n=1 Tax=Heterocephalus glaber TaxID=10181 RepID=G5BIA5_HETGA|nr:Ubiquitin carboxyl-terminal hydrolase 42 [Heterocephalus glaber]